MALPRTNIFIVDDHELVRAALRESLRKELDLFIVGEAGTVEEALRRIPLVEPDVALLDVRLPDGDGLDICRKIRQISTKVRCLFLSYVSDETTVTNAVIAGAAGYLRKDIRIEQLVDAIRKVAAGESLLSFETLQSTLVRLKDDTHRDAGVAALTDTEKKVLDLIADGLSNREIAEQMVLAEQTVKNYVSRVLTKLGMRRRTEAALYAQELAQKDPYNL